MRWLRQNLNIREDITIQRMMKDYYKQDSNRPDFLDSLPLKVSREKQCDDKCLVNILGIVNSVEDKDLKLYLIEKLLQEIVLYITGE